MHWLKSLWREVRSPDAGDTATSAGLGLGAILSTLDWENVRGEVDRESRARIVLIGASGAGKSTLLNTLKGTLVSMPTEAVGPGDDLRLEDYGLFAVVDVPERSPNGQLLDGDTTALMLNGADLIVWVLDGAAGLRAWEHEWICRVRAMSRPLLLVLNKLDQVGERSGRDVESSPGGTGDCDFGAR